MKVFATYNIKGGVGKTATAVNLSYLASLEGSNTLVWDLDPQGATSFYFRIRPKVKGGGKRLIRGKTEIDPLIKGTDFDNLDLLPADFSYRNLDLFLDHTRKPGVRLRKLLRPLGEEYDVLFLDCAPNISLVSESVFRAADALLVPIIPTTLSLRTLEQLSVHLRKSDLGTRVVPFFCMVDRRKKLHRQICEQAGEGPYEFARAVIPYSSLVEQMGLYRAPLATYAHRSPPALAYQQLWGEIRELG